jgi:hypothetical protein
MLTLCYLLVTSAGKVLGASVFRLSGDNPVGFLMKVVKEERRSLIISFF